MSWRNLGFSRSSLHLRECSLGVYASFCCCCCSCSSWFCNCRSWNNCRLFDNRMAWNRRMNNFTRCCCRGSCRFCCCCSWCFSYGSVGSHTWFPRCCLRISSGFCWNTCSNNSTFLCIFSGCFWYLISKICNSLDCTSSFSIIFCASITTL